MESISLTDWYSCSLQSVILLHDIWSKIGSVIFNFGEVIIKSINCCYISRIDFAAVDFWWEGCIFHELFELELILPYEIREDLYIVEAFQLRFVLKGSSDEICEMFDYLLLRIF